MEEKEAPPRPKLTVSRETNISPPRVERKKVIESDSEQRSIGSFVKVPSQVKAPSESSKTSKESI